MPYMPKVSAEKNMIPFDLHSSLMRIYRIYTHTQQIIIIIIVSVNSFIHTSMKFSDTCSFSAHLVKKTISKSCRKVSSTADTSLSLTEETFTRGFNSRSASTLASAL